MDSVYNDPIWEYVLISKLQPYMEAVKRWWNEYDKLVIHGTGVYPIVYEDLDYPIGLSYRVTSTPVRSPIKNIQCFPFIPTSYLQITGIPGGVNKMIERECSKQLKIDNICLIEKHGLPSTYHKGQFIAFIPEDVLAGKDQLGKYVYLTLTELQSLANNELKPTVVYKCARYL